MNLQIDAGQVLILVIGVLVNWNLYGIKSAFRGVHKRVDTVEGRLDRHVADHIVHRPSRG